MSLFQKTVIDNYLSKVKDEDFDTNWNTFKDYYLKEDTQERIKSKKEEEFQHDFLEFIFDNCLGYNIKDSADQNLFKEVKNVTDSKKADGAIKQGEDIVAVIELKSTKTKDFNEIQKQAFGYKNNHPNCRYVVSSNFQKLRFYIDDATKFEEFDLFKLNKEDFKLLWVCLSKDNLFDGVAKKLKSESILEEESITKKLYKDYSEFRKEIFNNLVESNPEIDKLTLFKKTQKLLDRFLFIFFAEDRGLVPTNSISKIIDQWEDSFTGSDSLYTVFKQYFKLLNEGRPKRGDKDAIYAYNGGLFADDEVLNTIKIDDDLLFKHTKNLSHYDFRSEISVDILGHIFEHSLSEIEEIQKEISGEEVEQSKRKKDGIFYTPAYITKYMVENTVGKLCDEKKKELEINEENYSDPKRRTKVRIENLDSYREWLLDLKICDPACGSGAFLNQALNFLIDEHNYIDDLKNSYLGGSIPFSDIENSILENNLYGVDINEESVEIAKLSLWLRTAQKERKLTSLSNNIKCGNSLINDKSIAGDKAFNWEEEFSDIFKRGGFDVVIGNPPYVVVNNTDMYNSYEWNNDLYLLFYEKILKTSILKDNGEFSFITPRFFAVNKNCFSFRDFILNDKKYSLRKLVETSPFKDAETECLISFFSKEVSSSDKILVYEDLNSTIIHSNVISKKYCNNNEYKEILTFLKPHTILLLDKIKSNSIPLDEITTSKRGMEIGKRNFESEGVRTLVGYDLDTFSILFDNNFISKSNNQYKRLEKFFDNKLIYLRRVSKDLKASISDEKFAFNKNIYGISVDENIISSEFVLALLNSKLLNFYYKNKFSTKKNDVFPEIQTYLFKQLPIKINTEFNSKLSDIVKTAIDINSLININRVEFVDLFSLDFEVDTSKNIDSLFSLDVKSFLKKTSEISSNYNDDLEIKWYRRFSDFKSKEDENTNRYLSIMNDLNDIVYKLYGLTKEEIEIVENS